ncbi:PIN domain-containing protein [Riemerella columbina]|uniref:PIN domain-containing protein n=1 Tax=Riemerella columbina TaxID=103810 RepID=UPI00036B06E7|nr:PIN domain-containing protein [Riemerella columbina]
MIVITDSNIFYSAIIAPKGKIAGILREKRTIQFTAPSYLIEEIKEHSQDIADYLKISKKEVLAIFQNLLENVSIIGTKEIPQKDILEAVDIVKDIDIDDVFFVALHLHTHHKIWTGDKELIKGLKLKGYDICITTEELSQHTYK